MNNRQKPDDGAAYLPTLEEIEAAKRLIRERNLERKRNERYDSVKIGKLDTQARSFAYYRDKFGSPVVESIS